MSKRKLSTPVQSRNSSRYSTCFERELSKASTSKEMVSLDTSGADSLLDTSDVFITKLQKIKNLLKQSSSKYIILGEISFELQVPVNSEYEENNTQLSLFANNENEYTELILQISLNSNLSKNYIIIEITDEFLGKAMNDLLTRHYTWIVKDFCKLKESILCINIAVLPENMPIAKARNVAELFTRKILPDYSGNVGTNIDSIEDFFTEMQANQQKNLQLPNVNVQHEKLKPTLCPYQGRAVKWMLLRESDKLHPQDSEWQSNLIETFTSHCGTLIYYNKYSQVLFVDKLEFPPFPKGGILADEMGLGKTVAVIALVLNNIRDMSPEMETDEYLMPLVPDSKSETKPINLKNKNFDPEYELKVKNLEDYLTPHEELIYSKAVKGSALKKALNKWYESSLSEFSTSTPKRQKKSKNTIKCLCGDSTKKGEKMFVECQECKRIQHVQCVGFKINYQYFCPLCWSKQKLVKSNGTLIITPPSIYHQWMEEIKKHVTEEAFPNGVFMYDDIKTNFIQPSILASYDIVICTYTRLRSELNRALLNESSRKLRNEERFLKQCSPLTQVNWWRLCLDEAQMVEIDGSAINQMSKLIPAVNRWSVTGTPIQKSINDIYHLIDFLRVEPFTDKDLWNSMLYMPYMSGYKLPLCSTVSQIFWRNSKETVSDELDIPKQTVRYHFLKFTPIEQNFYMREHALSSCQFAEGLRRSRLNVKMTIDSLDKNVLTKLLKPLLNLRQACSHPLAVKGNKISAKTGNMTLTDLFKYLYNKTKVECEEELRKYIAALNGMAGLFCISEDWGKAVEYYRRVLQVAEEYKGKVHVDSLQRIHTLTNLAEVLQVNGEGIPPTLRDDSLKTEAQELEDKYMEKALGDLKSEQNLSNELSLKIDELKKKFQSHSQVWWLQLISTLTIDNAIEELIDKVSMELLATQSENKKTVEVFLTKISSPKTIEVLLGNWLKSVEGNRANARKHLRALNEMSWNDLMYRAVDCHLRTFTSTLKKKKCELCVCENVLLDYECTLFAVSRKVLKEEYEKVLDGAQTKGSWKAHNAEKVLKVLLNISKNKPSTDSWAIKDGRSHIKKLEAMKKEFKQLRVVWMSLNHQIQARDEVNMCKMRLRLRLPGEPLPPKPTKLNLKEQNKVETIYIIEHHEVESQKLKLVGEMEVSRSEFKKKYGTLLYLDNLGKKENAKPEPCPVCKTSLENQWCVLQCGHSYCIDCVRILLMRNFKPSISCPICREITKSTNLSFIDLSGREENNDIKVVGEHSTKVEAIVRTLLELIRADENTKVLIFSTWAVVLKVMAVALGENGISFRRMPGCNYQTHLKEFKDPKMKITALLLPISWGSKGLNLIEATHVLFVEPIMNPAEELQALGRVHRIGQTKETVVHRFLIKGTIEEKIYDAVSEAKDKWNKRKVTLGDLKNLFDIKSNIVKIDE